MEKDNLTSNDTKKISGGRVNEVIDSNGKIIYEVYSDDPKKKGEPPVYVTRDYFDAHFKNIDVNFFGEKIKGQSNKS